MTNEFIIELIMPWEGDLESEKFLIKVPSDVNENKVKDIFININKELSKFKDGTAYINNGRNVNTLINEVCNTYGWSFKSLKDCTTIFLRD